MASTNRWPTIPWPTTTTCLAGADSDGMTRG
jgi:hypothetical protein